MDLLINAALTASSIGLFCYWFRYSCLLILAAETAHDHSDEVAVANQLSFPEVRSRLRNHNVTDFDYLHKCLERDFAVIAFLLGRTRVTSSDTGVEDAMLKIHYCAMSAWFRLTRSFVREAATHALEEMSLVVAHLANQLGARRLALD